MRRWTVFLFVLACASVCLSAPDLFIGTKGVGNTTPAATYPFGLIQAGPDLSSEESRYRADIWHSSGYQRDDEWVWRFSQTHLSGTGCQSLGDFGIMPYGGAWDPEERAFRIDHATEVAEPGYYSVEIENGLGKTRCEIVALAHTAIYRFRFGSTNRNVRMLLDLDWGLSRVGPADCWGRSVTKCRLDTSEGGDGWVLGGRRVWNWCDYEYGFAVRFPGPIGDVAVLREPDGRRGGIYSVDLGAVPGNELLMAISLSGSSEENARKNLLSEFPAFDFDGARRMSAAAWRTRLGLIELGEATDVGVRKNFETAVYHLFCQPNIQSDVGAAPEYSTFSTWDTFRAAHPLYTIISPGEARDFVFSMLDQCDRQGYLPIWALGGSETHCMVGHHAVPIVVDACLKGLIPESALERAYKAVRQSLTVNHKAVNDATWGLTKEDWDVLDRYGYYPYDMMSGMYGGRRVVGESAARTMECAYDDACAARLASRLGHEADARFFSDRSQSWKKVFDASIGYARARDSVGKWREPFDRHEYGRGPFNGMDFCEGNSCQYSWHVMQDPLGLVALLGGRERAGERLDALFAGRAPDENDKGFNYSVTGCIGQYVHGNEISHHIAYFYQFTDRPEKTAPAIRRICESQYQPRTDGLCGNDDCGQMSAWYVFSSLGFYPFDPCGGVYVIGAPQVPSAVIHLANGRRFRMIANDFSKRNVYVKSVRLNGRILNRPWISHEDIVRGGELVFDMDSRSPARGNANGGVKQ